MLRFAPSPIKDMNLNDLRIALLNYIVSKQRDEGFIVRIEDGDKDKNVEGKDQEILDTLTLFGIEYSQVVYQSQNVRFHTAMALQLIHEKKAFNCFCSDEWLEKKKQEAKEANKPYSYDGACENLPAELVIDNENPFTVRIKKPQKDNIQEVDSFVIMNHDKIPTYDFSCAIDDMLSDISLIIRDEKYLNNTLKQEHVRVSLNYDKKIKYTHMPAIENGDDFSIKELLEAGYLPEAISNYLISMLFKAPKNIFSIEDTIKWFDIKNISNSPTHFDMEVLKTINKEHLKNMDSKELSRYVGFADEEIGELAKIYLTEASTTKELRSKIEPVFSQKNIPDDIKEEVDLVVKTIKTAPYFDEYSDFKEYILKEVDLKDENFDIYLKILLTGTKETPEIEEIYKHLKNYIGEIIK